MAGCVRKNSNRFRPKFVGRGEFRLRVPRLRPRLVRRPAGDRRRGRHTRSRRRFCRRHPGFYARAQDLHPRHRQYRRRALLPVWAIDGFDRNKIFEQQRLERLDGRRDQLQPVRRDGLFLAKEAEAG